MKAINFILRKGIVFLVIQFIMQSNDVLSQKPYYQRLDFNYGVQVNEVLNGCGHGLLTELDLIIGNDIHEFAIGSFTQDKSINISGFSFQYKIFIVPSEGATLFLYYSFMYHYKNQLSNTLNEAIHPQTDFLEFEEYNTISNSVGIGVESSIKGNFYINAKIGLGGYLSKVVGEDNRNLNIVSREDSGFSVMGSLGFSYKINSKDKHRRRR
jgi:hypothetical protein